LVISGPLEAGSLRRLPGSSARHDPGGAGAGAVSGRQSGNRQELPRI